MNVKAGIIEGQMRESSDAPASTREHISENKVRTRNE